MSFNVHGDEDITNVSPIIIMHGVLGSKNNWNSLSKALHKTTKRKVIAVDARNHGDSPHTDEFSYDLLAADVIHLLNQMKLQEACLIGHSMGGRAMMRLALSYPERVEKLMVVDISPIQLSPTLGILKYIEALEAVPLDNSLPLSQGRRIADQSISDIVTDQEVRQFLLSNLTKINDVFEWKANLQSLKNNFLNIVEFPLKKETYVKPALFLGGTKSDYLKHEDHSKIRSYFPLACFEYLNTGHWVHAEEPQSFLNIASDFVNS